MCASGLDFDEGSLEKDDLLRRAAVMVRRAQ
jgi:hypothetical protein